jgi:hypothetical protein
LPLAPPLVSNFPIKAARYRAAFIEKNPKIIKAGYSPPDAARMEHKVRDTKTKTAVFNAARDRKAFDKAAVSVKKAQADYKAFCEANGRTPHAWTERRFTGIIEVSAGKRHRLKPFIMLLTELLHPTGL